ncbi:MAG TPA: tetratricopeptide repeat protein [Candidatus Polarisedimenticolia bacterium]|nr:tetratricopeptide repeat protein [Candidatus Polarisedimenticolia bacterium]
MRAFAPIVLLALLAVTAIACWPALDAPFTFDEQAGVATNRAVHPGASWKDALTYRFSPDQTRPLFFASLLLDARLWGMEPRGFRRTDGLLHLAAGVLVWLLLRRGLRHTLRRALPRSTDPFLTARRAEWAALAGTAVFLLHPLQSESILYIWGRAGILSAMACYAAILAVPWKDDPGRGLPAGLLRWGLAMLAAVAALLSKEDAVALPAIALVVWIVAERRPWRPAVLRALVLVFPVLAFLALRTTFLGAVGRQVYARSPESNLLVQSIVSLRFLALTLVPYGQSIDHVQPVPPLAAAVGALLVCGALVGVSILAAARARGTATRLGAAGVLIGAASLALYWVVPVADVMPERRVYLLMLGAAYAVSGAAFALASRGVWPVLLLAALLAPALRARAVLWSDSRRLWEEAARENPGRARPLINLGVIAADRGDRAQAAALLDRALALEPSNPEALYNRGRLRLDAGDLSGAQDDLQRSVAADPTIPRSHINLGIVLLRQNDLAGAEEEFRAALAIDPGDPRGLTNLAEVRRASGFADEAIGLYRQALASDPGYSHAAGRLGVALEDRGDLAGALAAYRDYLARGAESDADRVAVEAKVRSLVAALAGEGTIR